MIITSLAPQLSTYISRRLNSTFQSFKLSSASHTVEKTFFNTFINVFIHLKTADERFNYFDTCWHCCWCQTPCEKVPPPASHSPIETIFGRACKAVKPYFQAETLSPDALESVILKILYFVTVSSFMTLLKLISLKVLLQ